VSATSKLLGDEGDVHLSFAAQTYAIASVAKLAKEESDLNALNTQRVVHNTLAIFFETTAEFHLVQ
jgi:hypothetical protein